MKREIKFRAWDGINMHYLSDFANPFGSVLVLTSTDWQLGKSGYDWEVYGASSEENGILMQFTGLKDKAGKDIYESDLVKDMSGNIGKIIWGDYGWLIDFGQYIIDHERIDQWGEICGNIYDNPTILP